MLRVGVVGAGGISGSHIPVWEKREDAQLVAVCDIRPEMLVKHQNKHCYTDLDRMLDEENLDILDICLPTFLHADTAVKALERKIHVLCEKPISLHREDVKRIYDAAQRNHVCFMVAQVLRFWPEYDLLKEIYDSGRYGKLLSGSMKRLGNIPGWSWDNWMRDEKRSGLVPYDLHVHDLDFMVYAFGKPQSFICNRSKRPDQDYLHVVYQYDGFFISAEASWYNAPYPFGSDFRFQFEKALVEMDHGTMKVFESSGNILDYSQKSGGNVVKNINLPDTDAFANEIGYFVNCVKAGHPADRIQPDQLETVIDILNSL